jgi:hypothetical protein
MFQLQSSHHQAVNIRSIKGNHKPVVYIQLNMTSIYLNATHKIALTL